jgi:amino acid adenylation domain-containing protein/non-ribosomal peptide synthase protein (TIGR01720 family)
MQYIQTETSDGTAWKQIYRSSILPAEIKVLDIAGETDHSLHNKLTDWQGAFNLSGGSLFQMGYIYGFPDKTARIYLAFHHLIIDTVSWRILIDDLQNLYSGQTMPPKGSSYRQWVNTVHRYRDINKQEIAYWQEELHGVPAYDRLRQEEASRASFELNSATTEILLHKASAAYNTEVNDLLLTAFAYSLRDLNESDVQCITLEGHGREPIDKSIDTSHTVGWFTSIFPVKLELQADVGLSIASIKEHLRKIPNKGIGFGSFAMDSLSECSFDSLPSVSFNYLGQFDNGGFWRVAGGESAGSNIRAYNANPKTIDVNGLVIDGKLQFGIVARLGKEKTKEFTENFRAHLQTIIQHCIDTLPTTGPRFTPSDFHSVRLSAPLLERLQQRAWSDGNKIEHIYPANSLQQGFIFHSLTQAADDAYRVQSTYEYQEALDVDRYTKAWQLCIEKYPSLRTGFNWDEELIQVVYQKGDLEYKFHDVSHIDAAEDQYREICSIQAIDRERSFDLSRPTQLRINIIKQSEKLFTALKTTHHIVADGWSSPVLLSTLHKYYAALVAGKHISVTEDTTYLEAQEYIGINRDNILPYWTKLLSAVNEPNDISPMLGRSIDLDAYKYVELPRTAVRKIHGELLVSLKEFSKRYGITVNVILQFAWHKLVQAYSDSLHTVVGTTISGRDIPIEGIEQSVGLYINTLPLFIDWSKDITVLDQLNNLQTRIMELNTHGYVDLVRLQKEGKRLFHSLFVYENYPSSPSKEGELRVQLKGVSEKMDYPLIITAFEDRHEVAINLSYDGKDLSESRAGAHLSTLCEILQQVIEHPSKPNSYIRSLTRDEYEQIMFDWNNTDVGYIKSKAIHEVFEEQVRKNPNGVAVIHGDLNLSYQELDEKSNQLAHFLINRIGIKDEDIVPVMLDRSVDLLISLLGILKAGGTYLPLDPVLPTDRKVIILRDCAARTLISCDALLDMETQWDLTEIHNIVVLDDHITKGVSAVVEDRSELPDKRSFSKTLAAYYNPDIRLQPMTSINRSYPGDQLAYIIYTSGSTGVPKGAMIERAGMLNHLYAKITTLGITSSSVVAQTSSQSFDVSIWQFLSPLLAGGRVAIYDNDIMFDTVRFVRQMHRDKVDIFEVVPSYLAPFLEEIQEHNLAGLISQLRYLIVNGEVFSPALASKWFEICPNVPLINAYGPTEASDDISQHLMTESLEGYRIPLGKVLQNLKVYIVTKDFSLCPIGVKGEITIAGIGVGRGYLNNAALTSEKFVNNPFGEPGSQLYKTGDIGCWLSDGTLDYLGRQDDQVKVRGYRIELAEIEHVFSQIPGVLQCCVVAKKPKNATGTVNIVGYYVADRTAPLTESTILQELSKNLPEYMVPSAMMELTSFPVTTSGKLNKHLLPDPDFKSKDDFTAPVTELETIACEIWQKVLAVDRVGLTDDFFRIGGNSILAIYAANRMSKALGADVKVAHIFLYKNLKTLLSAVCSEQMAINNIEWEI